MKNFCSDTFQSRQLSSFFLIVHSAHYLSPSTPNRQAGMYSLRPWAFGSKGALFAVGTGTSRFVGALTREMKENPNRPIIVGESAYKMRPWDLTR